MKAVAFLALIYFCVSGIAAQEEVNGFDEYGQGRSVGYSILGRGIVGRPFRFILKFGDQFEFIPSLSARAYINTTRAETDFGFRPGISLLGSYNMLMKSYQKVKNNKIVKSYIGFKGGLYLVDSFAIDIGINWHRETFLEGDFNRSKGFDLGFMWSDIRGGNEYYIGRNSTTTVGHPLIYLNFDWNWFKQ